MKFLLAFDRYLGKVEVFLLSSSLVALLVLTLYSVVYRNTVAPLVLKLQGEAMAAASLAIPDPGKIVDSQPTEAPAAAPAAPAETPKPAEGEGAAAGEDNMRGDLDDDEDSPATGAAAAPAAKAGGDSMRGDLDDEEDGEGDEAAAPAAAAAAAAPAAKAGGDSMRGDLDDEEDGEGDKAAAAPPADAPAAAATADAAPAAAATADAAPAAAAAAPAPAAAPVAAAPVVDSAPVGELVMPEEPVLLKVLKWFNFGWINTVTLHLLLWVAFFGANVAASRRKHIKIDVLGRALSDKWHERLRIVLNLVAVAGCIALGRAAWTFMKSETDAGNFFYGSLPAWVGIGIIPLGFGLLTYHFLADALFIVLAEAGVAKEAIKARRDDLGLDQREGMV